MTFEFLTPAKAEFEEAFDWYLTRSPQAAEGFRNRVRRAIEAAMEWPNIGWVSCRTPRPKDNAQALQLRSDLFCATDVIYIVAISHNHREPHYWRSRISRR